MDSAIADFGGKDECSYFQNTEFNTFQPEGCHMPVAIMIQFFKSWSNDECSITKLSCLNDVPDYVMWQPEIAKYANRKYGVHISKSDITIQNLAEFFGHRGRVGGFFSLEFVFLGFST